MAAKRFLLRQKRKRDIPKFESEARKPSRRTSTGKKRGAAWALNQTASHDAPAGRIDWFSWEAKNFSSTAQISGTCAVATSQTIFRSTLA